MTRFIFWMVAGVWPIECQPLGRAYEAMQQARENIRIRQAERQDRRELSGDGLTEAIKGAFPVSRESR